MNYLIVGLGNIGAAYNHTRHNIGFEVIDALAQLHGLTFQPDRLAYRALLTYKGRKLTLIKPTTYMNNSGRAVRYWVDTLKIHLSRLLIISDDLHLPFAQLRLRTKGSHGGHNGLRSIIDTLSTMHYARLRFGIDRNFSQGQQADYVLAPFTTQEQSELPPAVNQATEMVLSFCWRGAQETMQHYNSIN